MQPNTLLTPKQASSVLEEFFGFRVPVGTLAQMRRRGIGPDYYKPVGRVVYQFSHLCDWMELKGQPQRRVADGRRGING